MHTQRIFAFNATKYMGKEDKQFRSTYKIFDPKLVDLLIHFLAQNDGKLSKRARKREFEKLTDREIQAIEHKYAQIFD